MSEPMGGAGVKEGHAFFAARTLVMIPAYNEALSLPELIEAVRRSLPGYQILVVNDGSSDLTEQTAKQQGVLTLNMPYNVGVGAAVQAGIQYAWRNGFEFLLRMDGDGQHPPSEAGKLLHVMMQTPCDLVIGSRFGIKHEMVSTRMRYMGVKLLAAFLSLICRARVTDPTSGYWLIGRRLIYVFSRSYPSDYPEPEALAYLRRLGYTFCEVSVRFEPRKAGVSSIGRWDTLFHAFKVLLALVVDRMRPVDKNLSSKHIRIQ